MHMTDFRHLLRFLIEVQTKHSGASQDISEIHLEKLENKHFMFYERITWDKRCDIYNKLHSFIQCLWMTIHVGVQLYVYMISYLIHS